MMIHNILLVYIYLIFFSVYYAPVE